MNAGLTEAVTFVAVAVAVACVGWLVSDVFLTRQLRIRARLGGQLGKTNGDQLPRAELFKNFSRLATDARQPLPSLMGRFQAMLA